VPLPNGKRHKEESGRKIEKEGDCSVLGAGKTKELQKKS